MIKEYLLKKNLEESDIYKYHGVFLDNRQLYTNKKYEWLNKNKELLKYKINKYDSENIKEAIFIPIYNLYSEFSGIVIRKFDDNDKHDSFFIKEPFKEKGSVLFNLNNAYKDIIKQDKVYICEGVYDTIALVKNGLTNVISLLGVNLSENQFADILKFTNNIVLSLDADSGGKNAIDKIYKKYKKYANFKYVDITADPDMYLVNNTIAQFISLEKDIK